MIASLTRYCVDLVSNTVRQVRREQTALALCYAAELSEFQGTQVLLGVVQFYNHMYYYMYNY